MQATDEIAVRLTAAEWNQVIAILSEGPFRVVAPILGKIHGQAQAQAQGALGEPAADVSSRIKSGTGSETLPASGTGNGAAAVAE